MNDSHPIDSGAFDSPVVPETPVTPEFQKLLVEILARLPGDMQRKKTLIDNFTIWNLDELGSLMGDGSRQIAPQDLAETAFNLLNTVHHFYGGEPDFMAHAATFVVKLFAAAFVPLRFHAGATALLAAYDLDDMGRALGRPQIGVMYWDRQLTSKRALIARDADGQLSPAFWELGTGCHKLPLDPGRHTLEWDGQPLGQLPDGPVRVFARDYHTALCDLVAARIVTLDATAAGSTEVYRMADPAYFLRDTPAPGAVPPAGSPAAEERNFLWERHVQLSGIQNTTVAIERLPFEVVCGYLHGRGNTANMPLPLHGKLADFLAQTPFTFQYFNSESLPLLCLADFARDFSRLSCLKDRASFLKMGAGLTNAYFDENIAFFQRSAGPMWRRLCDEREGALEEFTFSNLMAELFELEHGKTWTTAPIATVIRFAAVFAARLTIFRGDMGALPKCWAGLVLETLRLVAENVAPAAQPASVAGATAPAPRPLLTRILAQICAAGAATDGELARFATPGYGSLSDPQISLVSLAGKSGLGVNGTMFWNVLSRMYDNAENLVTDFGARTAQRLPSSRLATGHADRQVNIFAVNSDMIVDGCKINPRICQANAYNIGFLLWETSKLPPAAAAALKLLDEIWVPTEYLREVFEAHVDGAVPVINVGKKIDLRPASHFALRAPFGIPASAKVFLAIGDFGSSLPRKNIDGIVRAFQLANPDRADAALVIKIRKVERQHWSNHAMVWEKIETMIQDDPRIHVLEGNLSDDEYWALLHSVDCLISLHRSEGFGYGLAQSLGIGKITIATDYSGSQDFCTPDTSFVVSAVETPVNPFDMMQRTDVGVWAEPSVEDCAAAIGKVIAGGPEVARRIAAGQAMFQQKYNGDAFRRNLRDRLDRVSRG